MIHVYVGLTRKPLIGENIKIEQALNVTFCGDTEAKKYWEKKLKDAKIFEKSTHKAELQEIPGRGSIPTPTKEAQEKMKQHFIACLDWFAMEGFRPAGGAGDERIFYFDGDKE